MLLDRSVHAFKFDSEFSWGLSPAGRRRRLPGRPGGIAYTWSFKLSALSLSQWLPPFPLTGSGIEAGYSLQTEPGAASSTWSFTLTVELDSELRLTRSEVSRLYKYTFYPEILKYFILRLWSSEKNARCHIRVWHCHNLKFKFESHWNCQGTSQPPALGPEDNGHSHRMVCSLHLAVNICCSNHETR